MKKYKNYIAVFLAILTFCITICFVPIDASKFIPLIEKQAQNEFGIKVHIEKLILRFGPGLKVKAPIMHLMYEDGQKFGQFNNVRFIIPWSSLFKKDVVIKRLYANDFIVKINSNDKYLAGLIENIQNKDFDQRPNINLKKYSIAYKDCDADKIYMLNGHNLDLVKVQGFKNIKINTIGEMYINDKKYINYDIAVVPYIEMPEINDEMTDWNNILNQIENLDFHSDIMVDLKIYKNSDDQIQCSGLVNLDNISVMDKEKKNPKSFIYLTLWGNRTGILSNIYAEKDKKLYIEGNVTNSKKTEVDLRVKTDEINLAALYNKVKLFADCSKFKELNSIEGKLVADFNIKGEPGKIKSSGYMKITDASVKASGLDINKINSDIDFSNNTINISHAIGYVQNAPLMLKGKIGKTLDLDLLMSKVELKHMCPEKYGVKSGIVSLAGKIYGTFDNVMHKENIQIDNFAATYNKTDLKFSNLKIDTNKENTAYISNISVKPEKTEIIKLPMLKLLIDKDIITIPATNIFMPNSKLLAKAEVLNYNTKDTTFNVNLSGKINSKDLSGYKNLSSVYPVQMVVNGNKNVQNIESQIMFENAQLLGEPSIINMSAKVENNNLKLDDFSIISSKGTLSKDFKSNLKGQKKLTVSGIIENLENPVFKNLRVFIPQQLDISFMDTIARVKGDVFINGKLKQPEVVGQFSIQNLFNNATQLQINNLTADFNKNIAVINAPNIKLGDSVAGLNATVNTDITKEVCVKSVNIKSKYINLDTLLMYKDSDLFRLIPLNLNDGKFYAEKATVSIYGTPVHVSALSSDFSIKNNLLMTRNVYTEMFNGKMSGSLDFNLKDEGFKAKVQARGVSASPIFDIIAINKDRVSGTMDFDTQISGNLSSKQTLNGDIRFSVHNGRMSTLGKLEHLLYAQNVIADSMLRTSLSVVTKAITLKDTGLFKYLRGDIKMENGIANIKMLQSQGPLMSLYIKGQYNPSTDYAKLVVLGRLSDEVISGLGAFGDFSFNKLMIMLTGEENNKYNIKPEDLDKLPQLPMRNTKEFMSIINGILDKPSSVILFNWISYSQKSYRQKDVPSEDGKVPGFIDALPY